MLELEEELYQAIKEQNFLQADSLKEKINVLKEEISRLSKIPETIITEDNVREEKNDTATMVKCLDILYVAMQSIRVLTPTLRSLMCFVLNSLDVSTYRFYSSCAVCVKNLHCIYLSIVTFIKFNLSFFSILTIVYIY